jgi:hypothetical protein
MRSPLVELTCCEAAYREVRLVLEELAAKKRLT